MRTCMNCGAEVADNAKFCRSCGAKLMDPEDMTVILDEEPIGQRSRSAAAEDGYQSGNMEEYQGAGYDEYQSAGYDEYQGGNFDGYQNGSSAGYQNNSSAGYQNNAPGGYQSGGSHGYQGGGSRGYQAAGRPVKPVQSWDHTNEFDAKDVSENKAVAMLIYLLGFVGIIIALLAGTTSPYASFHVRQGLKFVVLDTLIAIVGFLFFLIMIPFTTGSLISGLSGDYYGSDINLGGFAAVGGFGAIIYILLGLFAAVLAVVKIICFFSICKGEAKEPPIVRLFGFLR